jgi:uracil-DNA glycosylase family 4
VTLGEGPLTARIMIVGEAWGEEEERLSRPFVGPAGYELERMLKEAGISRSECYLTNLVNARPPGNDLDKWIARNKKAITPEHVALRNKMVLPCILEGYKSLRFEIGQIKPTLIIALGNAAMWALTEHWGIQRYRGSMLITETMKVVPIKVIPTYHPAEILRQWSLRSTTVQDLRRAERESKSRIYTHPQWNFTVRPTFSQVEGILSFLLGKLDETFMSPSKWIDFDLETDIWTNHIKCAGLSWSLTEAICIPFIGNSRRAYWTEEEEAKIIYDLYQILTHPNVKVRGQNLLFDCQYTYRWWSFTPRVAQDTMISWHVAMAGLPKKLDFQASLLCDHYTQWKPERVKEKEGG